MNYEHKTPWELMEFLADNHAGFWREPRPVIAEENRQNMLWNRCYANTFPGNDVSIRWAAELTRFINYPNTNPLPWGILQAELHWMSLEGAAATPDGLRPTMLLSTALICYTDMYKKLNIQKMCYDTMKQLRKYGIDIQWVNNSIDEEHSMFAVPSRTSRRAVFGKGAIPILRRVAPVMKNCRLALLPLDRQPNQDDWLNMAEEAIFELNAYAEQNNYNWRAVLRSDWKFLCQEL